MKRLASLLVLVAATCGFAATASGADGAGKATYYLSVGDSLAEGYQPIGGDTQGYANQLFKATRSRYEQLQLVKLGCGGETTQSMVDGAPWCGFPAGSQLAQAEQFLRDHSGAIAFVTLDVGANDWLGDPEHWGQTIQTYLPVILARLRTAAGPGVPIIGMTYYPVGLPNVWFETHDISALLDYSAQVDELNHLLQDIYSAAGDPVARVDDAFRAHDTTLVKGTPLNVLQECRWTWVCAPPPLGPDIHANSEGYGAIAGAFLEQLH